MPGVTISAELSGATKPNPRDPDGPEVPIYDIEISGAKSLSVSWAAFEYLAWRGREHLRRIELRAAIKGGKQDGADVTALESQLRNSRQLEAVGGVVEHLVGDGVLTS